VRYNKVPVGQCVQINVSAAGEIRRLALRKKPKKRRAVSKFTKNKGGPKAQGGRFTSFRQRIRRRKGKRKASKQLRERRKKRSHLFFNGHSSARNRPRKKRSGFLVQGERGGQTLNKREQRGQSVKEAVCRKVARTICKLLSWVP